jgi:hypothetical protein
MMVRPAVSKSTTLQPLNWGRLAGREEHRDVEAAPQDLELLDGSGPVDVGGHHHGLPALLLDEASDLGRGGGLAASLETHHHDGVHLPVPETQRSLHRPHESHQLVVADLDEVVLGGHLHLLPAVGDLRMDDLPDRLFLHMVDEALDHVELHVGFQQRDADLLDCVLDMLLLDGHLSLEQVLRLSKPIGYQLKHASSPYR